MAKDAQQVKVTENSRPINYEFYRSMYSDAANASDDEIAAFFKNSRESLNRFANPTEFLQYALGKRLIPQNFDPIGYVLANADLWGMPLDWHAVLHYVQADEHRKAGAYERPFNVEFYRDLYLSERRDTTEETLLQHWRTTNSNGYGTLEEALLRNGFSSREWVSGFDHQAYAVANNLVEHVRNPVQRLVHFIEVGVAQKLAVSDDLEFDVAFFREIVPEKLNISDSKLYRFWVENGLLGTRLPPNERAMMRKLGLNLSQFPEGFDWQRYLAQAKQAEDLGKNKWSALESLINVGVLDSRPLPLTSAAKKALFPAVADRFVAAGMTREAEQVYDRLLLLETETSALSQHRADLALRDGMFAYALHLYSQIRAAGSANFWTWVNGGEAALALGELDVADCWVVDALALYPRSEKLGDLHTRIQHRRYDLAVQRHVALLESGAKETGLEHELDQIFSSLETVLAGPSGSLRRKPLRVDGPLRVIMLANHDLPQCTFYRVQQKLEQMAGTAVVFEIFEREQAADFVSAAATTHVAVFYRLAASVEVLRCIAACRTICVPTVYEIDDLVFEPANFPEAFGSYGGTLTPQQYFELTAGVSLVQHVIRLCDYGIASTDHLAVHLRRLVREHEALVHRNGLSRALATFAQNSQLKQPNKDVTVFYGSGTKAHAADFHDQLEPALLRLMAEEANVRFLACGYVNISGLSSRFPDRVEHVPPQDDRDAYLSLLLGADINISVLSRSEFNDCKSEIKWLEAAAFCVPSVVSDTGGFRETLVDGVHVLRCRPDPKHWYKALRKLVLDPAARAKIGEQARHKALDAYLPEVLGTKLEAELVRIATTGPSSQPGRKKRVLLVNVFFPPQTIGGATRVARDQASIMLERYSNEVDLAVMCGNDEASSPYKITAYGWRNVPVWSVSTPHREHMDWLHDDNNLTPLAERIVDAFKPDLVHFHCIQRLTSAVVKAVAARKIPYVVTAHDAWWISDHQFLLDHHERLRMPWISETYETAYNPHTRAESGSRRLALRSMLNNAAAILAVSETFADIYRRAGVNNVIAVPNGVPDLPALQAVVPRPGYVRLGHFGGITYHKGYFLLKQALKRGQFSRLTLLVLDHAMMPGEVRHEVWGATPVCVMGKVPQDQVGWLYGQIDVLCAPSLWPESYGLVTREALAYGRWVITSNLGAIGEDVVEGKNGFVVDISDQNGLARVLKELQDNPARYIKPPSFRPKLRQVDQQVDEIMTIYRSLMGEHHGVGECSGSPAEDKEKLAS